MKKIKIKVYFNNPQLDDLTINNMMDFLWEQPVNILKILKTDGELFIKLNDVLYIETKEKIEPEEDARLIKAKVLYNSNGAVKTKIIDKVFVVRWFDEDYYLKIATTEGLYLFNLRHVYHVEIIDKQREKDLKAKAEQEVQDNQGKQGEVELKGNIKKPSLERINRFRGRKPKNEQS